MLIEPPARGRGRPTLAHDNRRVRAFMSAYLSVTALTEDIPAMDDVLAGIAAAQTEGQASTRPLSVGLLFRVLASCDSIGSLSTSLVIARARGRAYSRPAVARYTAAARAASIATANLLDRFPDWDDVADPFAASN
jgi:hypothetical protein